MKPTTHLHGADRPPDGAVVFVLDGDGTVLQCTATVLDLTGRPAEEVRGRPMTDLVTDPAPWSEPLGGAADGVRELRAALLHRDGTPVEVDTEVVPLPAGGEARFLVCAVPTALGQRWTEDRALVRALFTQSRIGLAVHDTDLVARRGNLSPEFFGLAGPRDEDGQAGVRLKEIIVPDDAAAIEERLRQVLEAGEPLIDWEHSARRLSAPGEERALSLSAFRLHDAHERVIGVAAVFTDVTEQYAARRRLGLLHAAAARLGQTLDITSNAEELAGVLVPGFADLVSVDLVETMLEGRDPGAFPTGTSLRRVAAASADGAWPEDLYQCGETLRPQDIESDALRAGQPLLVDDVPGLRKVIPDPRWRRLVFPEEATSVLVVPLRARGQVLGALGMWRTGDRTPFDENDVPLVEEIASRAALSLENARRYTAELRTVETLQRSLLPPAGMNLSAAESAGTYVPAGTAAGVGGSWYDVIPLSSTRVAFVIGDVAGHGLNATATTGRLRTAVQTLADLDLAPEELLTHLDDLAVRLASTEPPSPDGGGSGVVGATCLYCVYDPVTGRCTMASAGHPAPVLTTGGGGTRCVDLRPGPALGTGGLPFEPAELHLTPGSVLAFHTNRLTVRAGSGEDGGGRMRLLREGLAAAVTADSSPADIGRAALDHVLTEAPADDVALLVARVRALPEGSTVAWRFTADPSVVSQARDLVTGQLAAWGLEDLAFTTELIVSELVTNAVRYAGSPIGLRLIRDKTLICEVSDPSQTQPHLRRARPTDEGGRGLFLIAQLAHRWGSRYTASGKTIWTEQSLDVTPEALWDAFL